jgi:alpha-L-rhamnosidase
MTRWWWFGGAVAPEEITRELQLMRDAGLGGVEIQPLYPVAVDDAAHGIRNIRYFSDEWYELLRHAIREGRRLGLDVDLTLGSGWPYGGPFIPTSLSARRLAVFTRDVVGPRPLEWRLTPHLTGDDRIVGVVAAPVGQDEGPELSRSLLLTDQPRPHPGDPREERGMVAWAAPEGEWRVYVLVDQPTGQQVKRPTLGMEGPVLDHFSAEALQVFLRAAGDRVMDEVTRGGAPGFRSIFCDSLEVYGADWTGKLLSEFRRRRGYDLGPYLPALWQEAGPDTPHVRYDYHLTLSDLMLDSFFRPLVDWSERRGMKARVQAHGALADVLQAYGVAHIPEGENIFLGDRYMVNLRHRRLASSAAHLYGRPLVSGETYTWLRTPLFMTTLEQMKAATDSTFLDGLNHLVNHGYSYSPPAAGEPGWAFYASTEINHTNTWWRHYPHVAGYVRRAQALLREGVSVNPVGVYLPLPDVFAGQGAGGLHMDVEFERQLGPEFLFGLRTAGFDFDLVHDHALLALARVEGGRLRAGTAAFSAVVVPAARLMPPASLARLAELAEAGGHVIFVERVPEGTPGLPDRAARDAELRATLARVWGAEKPVPGATRTTRGGGSVSLVADNAAAFARLATVLPPDFRIVSVGEGTAAAILAAARQDVGFLHRRSGAADHYLVANVSGEAYALRVQLGAGHRAPRRWDAATGLQSALAYEYVSAGSHRVTEIELRLDPFESCFVVFGTSSAAPVVTRTPFAGPFRHSGSEIVGRLGAGSHALVLGTKRRHPVVVDGLPSPVAVDRGWTLRLGPGSPVALPHLVSWNDLPAGRGFSGWGTYEVAFDVPAGGEDVEWEIDLGTVHETAEVTLNGKALGVAWKRPRRLDCGATLRAGRNELRVEVANLWIHQMLTRPTPPEWKAVDETFGIRWGRYGEVKPESVPPSGLLGPVRLVPWKRVRIRV